MKKNNFKEEKFKEILRINWFKWNVWWDLYWYERDDGYCIVYQKGKEIHIVDWEGDVFFCKNIDEVIGKLALLWIINRLF